MPPPALANLQKLEQHALYDLFLGVILILFWASVWGLIEELVTKIQEKKEIARWKIYLGILVFVMFVVGMCPEMLAKF